MSDEDDLLDPAEIEALLNSQLGATAGGGAAPPPKPAPAAAPAPAAGKTGDILSQTDLDDLFSQMGGAAPAPAAPASAARTAAAPVAPRGRAVTPDVADALLAEVEQGLAAALAPEPSRKVLTDAAGARSFEFQSFEASGLQPVPAGLENLQEVEVDIRIELGRTELRIEDVLKLREGSVVSLDKLAGDPVDILVNGRLVARGEVLVLNDNFCVRIAEIVSPTF